MLESRAEGSALGAAPDIAVVDVGLNFLPGMSKNLTELLKNYTSKQMARLSSSRPISHKKPASLCTNKMEFFFCDLTKI